MSKTSLTGGCQECQNQARCMGVLTRFFVFDKKAAIHEKLLTLSPGIGNVCCQSAMYLIPGRNTVVSSPYSAGVFDSVGLQFHRQVSLLLICCTEINP